MFENNEENKPAEDTNAAGVDETATEGQDLNGAGVDQTAAEAAEANKSAETAALDHAAEENGANVAGEGVETATGVEVFFEGRKVLRVLPEDQQGTSPKGFVRCEMSDATTVDVPEELFGSDLDSFKEEAAKASEEAANS